MRLRSDKWQYLICRHWISAEDLTWLNITEHFAFTFKQLRAFEPVNGLNEDLMHMDLK